MTTVKLLYGGAMWDKPTGTLRVSGLAIPMSSPPSLGDNVSVDLAGVMVTSSIRGNVVRVTSWVCTPIGYQFAGEKIVPVEMGGAVGTVFTCYAQYLTSIGLSVGVQTGISESQLVYGTSPHPNVDHGWLSLSGAIDRLCGENWAIPAVTDVPIDSMVLNGYENSSVVIGSLVAGANKVYVVDGFEQIVSLISTPGEVPDSATSITYGTHFGSSIVVNGGSADPTADPRPNGPLIKEAEIKSITEPVIVCGGDGYCEPVSLSLFSGKTPIASTEGVYLKGSNSPWAILSTISNSEWIRSWGPKSMAAGTPIASTLPSTILSSLFQGGDAATQATIKYYNDVLTALIPLYNEWFAATAFTQTSYTFKNLHPLNDPLIHQGPIIDEEFSLTIINNDFYNGMMTDIDGRHHDFEPQWPLFTYNGLTISSGKRITGDIVNELPEVSETKGLITCSRKIFKYETLCNGTTSLGDFPYLFKRLKEISIDYRISPVVLNLNSEFWNTPDANNNIFAVDSRGQRVWIFPHDNVEVFCRNLAIVKILTKWWEKATDADIAHILSVVMLLKNNITTLFYLSNMVNVSLDTAAIDQWRRFLNEMSQWVPDPLSQLINTASAVSCQSSSTEAAAIAYKVMRARFPDLAKKMKKKAPYLDDSLNYDNAEADSDKIYYHKILKKAITWVFDYGGIRNISGFPIPISKTTITYSVNSRTTVKENLITGDRHSSEESFSSEGGSLLYMPPATVRASTATTLMGSGATSSESTRISDWDHLATFKGSMSAYQNKRMVFYSVEENFDTPREGYAKVITLLDKKDARNIRFNVQQGGRSTVSYGMMGTESGL